MVGKENKLLQVTPQMILIGKLVAARKKFSGCEADISVITNDSIDAVYTGDDRTCSFERMKRIEIASKLTVPVGKVSPQVT